MEKKRIGNLIVETLNGNKISESKLYCEYRKKINLFLAKKYGYNIDHPDDVSEILIRIFNILNKYNQSKSTFDTWVYNIAKNYMIDKHRKCKPIYVTFVHGDNNKIRNNNDMYEPSSYLMTPYEDLEINDSINHLSNVLTKDEFSILRLKYCEGYSYSEIGKKFSCSESQISNKVSWIKKKIKRKNGDL